MFKQRRYMLASLFIALWLTACASPNQADSLYINTMISGELMPGVYGQVNIGSVPDYVTIYDEPLMIVPQPVYAVPVQPIYLYVPPYQAYHWRDNCGYYNACARPVYFICARDYRPHYFEPRYYNTRVYDPPRTYHSYPTQGHTRHYETMHQREMNRDSHYRGPNADNRGPYYPQDNSYRRDNTHYRNNDNDRRDNNGQQQQRRDDRNPQRQQFINNNRNDDNRQQINRQQVMPGQPPRNDMMRVRTDDSRGNNRNEVRQPEVRQTDNRPAVHRTQTNDYRPRERTQMPVQQSQPQPSFRAQGQGQEQRDGGRHYGGGHDDRRREERR